MRSRVWKILRKIAMAGLTDEEVRRMSEEDSIANTSWIPSGRVGVEDCFMEFGARREDYGYDDYPVDPPEEAVPGDSDQPGRPAGIGTVGSSEGGAQASAGVDLGEKQGDPHEPAGRGSRRDVRNAKPV